MTITLIYVFEKADQPGYEWVKRHTWQSWRERYKKNAERLDRHIAAIVNAGQSNGSIPQGNPQFGYFKLNGGRQTQRSRTSRKRKASQIGEGTIEPANANEEGPSDMQDAQDAEWAIREGSDPVPDWAKRNENSGESSQPSETMRQREADGTFRTFVLAPVNEDPSGPPVFSTATEFAADFGQANHVDPVENEILTIARDHHFLPDEVRAYYQRNGDLLATRQRFERVRALINSLP